MRVNPGAGCTAQKNGSSCEGSSFSVSRSAGAVLSEASVFGRQMWIISAIIKATGPCSRILIICRAFVTAAIAGKHMRNCSKIGARIYHDKAKNDGTLRHVRDMYTRIRDSLQLPPPGQKSFEQSQRYRQSPYMQIIFPIAIVETEVRNGQAKL